MTESAPLSATLALIEDHMLFGESLQMALELDGINLLRPELGRGPIDVARVVRQIVGAQPVGALLDLDLGEHGSGLDLIPPLSSAWVPAVVLTSNDDLSKWGECLEAGAQKVIHKSVPLSEVLSTVHRLVQGLPLMTAAEREELVQFWRDQTSADRAIHDRLAQLTWREADMLGQLMLGKQVAEIAKDQFVSESTVRTHVKSLLAKLQVSSQLTAVGLANKVKWSPPRRPPGAKLTLAHSRPQRQRGR